MIKSEKGTTVLTGEETEILADITCIIREFMQTSGLPEPVKYAAVVKDVSLVFDSI